MVATYIIAGIIAVLLIVSIIWVTGKAYSRKWEE